MKKWVELEFEIGTEVYLKTDPDQRKRIVTGMLLRPTGHTYELTHSNSGVTWHYGFEISITCDVVHKTSSE